MYSCNSWAAQMTKLVRQSTRSRLICRLCAIPILPVPYLQVLAWAPALPCPELMAWAMAVAEAVEGVGEETVWLGTGDDDGEVSIGEGESTAGGDDCARRGGLALRSPEPWMDKRVVGNFHQFIWQMKHFIKWDRDILGCYNSHSFIWKLNQACVVMKYAIIYQTT